MIKVFIKSILKRMFFAKPIFEMLAQLECRIAAAWASSAHKRLMAIQWCIPPQPEHFDHAIDLYYQWLSTRNSLWLERGIFGSLALKGGEVLELSCGDGFNAKNFYSLRSRHVVACDFCPKAIYTAKTKNSAPNIDFELSDIRTDMPKGKYDNIVWDAAIEHFTEIEIAKILTDIKERLMENGVLSGYTIVENIDGSKSLHTHEYEFKSKEDLLRFFKPHFKNVTVFETRYPGRHNLYFWASDGQLPFSDGWPYVVHSCKSDEEDR
jgi:2-polyprenyl-3-methyl-5-hydroxy-6-metoxy-1,4-benzoquinol methylase